MTLTLRGVKIPDDPKILTPSIRTAIVEGYYEAPEAQQIEATVTAGDRVLDLGAGIGFTSALAARCGAGSILCYEANPALADFIRAVHAMNDVTNARIVHAAVVREGLRASLHVREDFRASSTLKTSYSYERRVDVRAVLANDIFHAFRPNVILCDVEGEEANIFPDADLATVTAIIVETHRQTFGEDHHTAVIQSLEAKGFAATLTSRDGSVVTLRRANIS